MNDDLAASHKKCFLVFEVGTFGLKERILCLTRSELSLLNAEKQELRESWTLKQIESLALHENETDFSILTSTQRHKSKRAWYRYSYPRDVIIAIQKEMHHPHPHVLVKELSSQFTCLHYIQQNVGVPYFLKLQLDGIYECDKDNILMHIPLTAVVSVDLVQDDESAMLIYHSHICSVYQIQQRNQFVHALSKLAKFHGITLIKSNEKTMEFVQKSILTSGEHGGCIQFIVQENHSLVLADESMSEYTKEYQVVFSRPIVQIFRIQLLVEAFVVLYDDGVSRQYFSNEAERIVCDILTSCHAMKRHFVDLVGSYVDDTLLIVSHSMLQRSAQNIALSIRDPNAYDREIRAAQSCITQQLVACTGKRKDGNGLQTDTLDRVVCSLVVNTSASGLAPPYDKPIDKIIHIIVREIHRKIMKEPNSRAELPAYLQCLHRLLAAPAGMNELLMMLKDKDKDLLCDTFMVILRSCDKLSIFWTFSILIRMASSKIQALNAKSVFISNSKFIMSVFHLFDLRWYIDTAKPSILSTRMLCTFLQCLLPNDSEQQSSFSAFIQEQISSKYDTFVKILLIFPDLVTVEACVSILCCLVELPSVCTLKLVHVDGEEKDCIESPYFLLDIHSPALLLRQYQILYSFCISRYFSKAKAQKNANGLILRYRGRSVFLQEFLKYVHRQNGIEKWFTFDFNGYEIENGQMGEECRIAVTSYAVIVKYINGTPLSIYNYHELAQDTECFMYNKAVTFHCKRTGHWRSIFIEKLDNLRMQIVRSAGLLGIFVKFTNSEPNLNAVTPSCELKSDIDALYIEVYRHFENHSSDTACHIAIVDGRLYEKCNDIVSSCGLADLKRIIVSNKATLTSPDSPEKLDMIAFELANSIDRVYIMQSVEAVLVTLYDQCRSVGKNHVCIMLHSGILHSQMTLAGPLSNADKSGQQTKSSYDYFFFLLKMIGGMHTRDLADDSTTDRIGCIVNQLNCILDKEDMPSTVDHKRYITFDVEGIIFRMLEILESALISSALAKRICFLTSILCLFGRAKILQHALLQSKQCLESFKLILIQALMTEMELITATAIQTIHNIIMDNVQLLCSFSYDQKLKDIIYEKKFWSSIIDILELRRPISSLAVLDCCNDMLYFSYTGVDVNLSKTVCQKISRHFMIIVNVLYTEAHVELTVEAFCLLRYLMLRGVIDNEGQLRDLALESGLTMQTLTKALFHPTKQGSRAYQFLASLCICHHGPSFQVLRRIFPSGMLRMLSNLDLKAFISLKDSATELPLPASSDDFVTRLSKRAMNLTEKDEDFHAATFLTIPERLPLQNTTNASYAEESASDITILAELVDQEFSLPDLIWNSRTREALKDALYNLIDDAKKRRTSIESQCRWNYHYLSVSYIDTSSAIRARQYFLRVLWNTLRREDIQWELMHRMVRDPKCRINASSCSEQHLHLMYSMEDLFRNPAEHFNELYQSWIEGMCTAHLPLIKNYAIKSTEKFIDQHTMVYWKRKLLLEFAFHFPTAFDLTPMRAEYILDLIRCTFMAEELIDLLKLFCSLFEPSLAYKSLADNDIELLLHIASASQISRPYKPKTVVNSINGYMSTGAVEIPDSTYDKTESDLDFPMLELDCELANVCSVPASSIQSMWRVKRIRSCESTKEDAIISDVMLSDQVGRYIRMQSAVETHLIDVELCYCTAHIKDDENVHKWLPFHHALRWRLLLDSTGELITATSVAVQVLLSGMKYEAHSSASETSVVPLLAMNSYLKNSDRCMAMLLQLLVINDEKIRRNVCLILMELSQSLQQSLYRRGAFFFLLCPLPSIPLLERNRIMSLEEALLLQKTHRIQDTNEREAGECVLSDILPSPLIDLLDNEDASTFADTYNCCALQKKVLWTTAMREQLHQSISDHLNEFTHQLSRDCSIAYNYSPLPPIQYIELKDQQSKKSQSLSMQVAEVIHVIEGKWMQLFTATDRNSADSSKMEDIDALRDWGLSTKSSISELRSYFRSFRFQSYDEAVQMRISYNRIAERITAGEAANYDRVLTLECFKLYCTSQLAILREYPQFIHSNVSPLPLFILHLFDNHPRSQLLSDFPDTTSRFLLEILYELLNIAPSNIDLLLKTNQLWDTLLRKASGNCLELESQNLTVEQVLVLITIVRISGSLLSREEVRAQLLIIDRERGELSSFDFSGYLSGMEEPRNQYRLNDLGLLLLTFFEKVFGLNDDTEVETFIYEALLKVCGNPSDVDVPASLHMRYFWRTLHTILSSDVAISEAILITPSGKSICNIFAAFKLLRQIILGSAESEEHTTPSPLLPLLPLKIMKALLSVSVIDDVQKSCKVLQSTIREPTCIWHDATRNELRQLALQFSFADEGSSIAFFESLSSFVYADLESEPFVGGVYLNSFIEQHDDNPFSLTYDNLLPISVLAFIKELFMFLGDNERPDVVIYSDTLPVLQCLSIIADHDILKLTMADCLRHQCGSDKAKHPYTFICVLGKYLLPYDAEFDIECISSCKVLSNYGFTSQTGIAFEKGDKENVNISNSEYLLRQELALEILIRISAWETDLENMLGPFSPYTWSLQVIADHSSYQQAYYAIFCLAELCASCSQIANYVCSSGLWLEILAIAVQSRQYMLLEHYTRAKAIREPAFGVLHVLLTKCTDLKTTMVQNLKRFLPYPIIHQIVSDPYTTEKFFESDFNKSDLVWDNYWRNAVRTVIDRIICRSRKERSDKKQNVIQLQEEDFVPFATNLVAGMNLNRFLAVPDPHNLTCPLYNLDELFRSWFKLLDEFTSANRTETLNRKTLTYDLARVTRALLYILDASLPIRSEIDHLDLAGKVYDMVKCSSEQPIRHVPLRYILNVAVRMAGYSGMPYKEIIDYLFFLLIHDRTTSAFVLEATLKVLKAYEKEPAGEKAAIFKFLNYDDCVHYLLEVVNTEQGQDSKRLDLARRLLSHFSKVREAHDQKLKDETPASLIERASMLWYNITLMEARNSERKSILDQSDQVLEPTEDDSGHVPSSIIASVQMRSTRLKRRDSAPQSNQHQQYTEVKFDVTSNSLVLDEDIPQSSRHSLPHILNPHRSLARDSELDEFQAYHQHRPSLLEGWNATSTVKPRKSLTALTMSRRGRHATAIQSRAKSKGKSHWWK